jgi:hypothetical protein
MSQELPSHSWSKAEWESFFRDFGELNVRTRHMLAVMGIKTRGDVVTHCLCKASSLQNVGVVTLYRFVYWCRGNGVEPFKLGCANPTDRTLCWVVRFKTPAIREAYGLAPDPRPVRSAKPSCPHCGKEIAVHLSPAP